MKSSRLRNVWVAVPTYNEAANIIDMLDAISKVFTQRPDLKGHVLIIDDKSPDGTGDLARSYVSKTCHVEVLDGNKAGLGVAYARGFDHILNKSNVHAVVQMDADFSHNPSDIPRLVDALDDADVAIGSRYVSGGFIPGDWPMIRIINTRVARWVARYIGGISHDVQDPTAGSRAHRPASLRQAGYHFQKTAGYVFQVGQTHNWQINNFKIAELPIDFSDRKAGSSKIRASDISEFVWFCVKLNPLKQLRKNGMPIAISLISASFAFLVVYMLDVVVQPSSLAMTALSAAIAVAASDLTIQLTKFSRRVAASTTRLQPQAWLAFGALIVPLSILTSIAIGLGEQLVIAFGLASFGIFGSLRLKTKKLMKQGL